MTWCHTVTTELLLFSFTDCVFTSVCITVTNRKHNAALTRPDSFLYLEKVCMNHDVVVCDAEDDVLYFLNLLMRMHQNKFLDTSLIRAERVN